MSTAVSRPRVLVIAEAANPEWVSVPLVGWSHARALFDHADVHLVTQVRNQEAIEKTGFQVGREFSVIDTEGLAKPVWKVSDTVRRLTGIGFTLDTALASLAYPFFEHQLWQRFGPAIARGDYDVVHRLTPLSPTTPSIIAKRCADVGVPFVWGPINGGVPWPAAFRAVQHKEREWLHAVRGAHRLLPGYASTRRHAAATVVGSLATWEQLPRYARSKAVYLPENAIDPSRFPGCVEGPVRMPLRVAFVGRLVPYKGADMLIEATAELIKAGKLILDIIGDGPERPFLRSLADRLGLGSGVHLDGWVPHHEMADRLRRSDVFGFPSVREFGGGVVLEAMALGLVPVVADYAGPAELVTDDTGYRIPMASREDLIARFRERFEALVASPELLRPMGQRARARVLELFTWDAKARQMLEVYRWVMGGRGKPDFGRPLARLA